MGIPVSNLQAEDFVLRITTNHKEIFYVMGLPIFKLQIFFLGVESEEEDREG